MARLRYNLAKVPELDQVPVQQRAALERRMTQFHLMNYLNPDLRRDEHWRYHSSTDSWLQARIRAEADLEKFKLGKEDTHSTYIKTQLMLLAKFLGRSEAAERILVIAGNEGANALLSTRISAPTLPNSVIRVIADNEWRRDAALIGVAHLLTDNFDGKRLFAEVMRTRMEPWSKGYGVIGTVMPARSTTSLSVIYAMHPKNGNHTGPVKPNLRSEESELNDAISSSVRQAA